jgi:hypothetical protein
MVNVKLFEKVTSSSAIKLISFQSSASAIAVLNEE